MMMYEYLVCTSTNISTPDPDVYYFFEIFSNIFKIF